MKTILLILSTLIFLQSCSDDKALTQATTTPTPASNNEAQSFVSSLNGKGESYTYATFQDSEGNMYVGGNFKNDISDTNEFKDVNGNALLGLGSSVGVDGYIMKIDKSGKQLWIKIIGGEGSDSVQGVTTDGTSIYVIGKFADNAARSNASVDFSGTALAGSSSTASTDIFVAKLDSNGTQQWIKTLGGADNADTPTSVVIDSSGSIYVGGIYYNNSTNAKAVVDFSGTQLNGRSTSNSQDGFVAKLSSADGSQTWIKTLGGTGVDRVYRMALDSTGSIIVPGQFANTTGNVRSVLDFSNTALLGVTATSSLDGFVAKLSSSGTQTWIKTYGGTSDEDFLDAVAVDEVNDIFVTGSFGNDTSNTKGAIDFAGNQLDGLTGTSSRDILLAKLSSTGTQSWIKRMGGTGSDRAQGLGRDSSGNIYVAGYFTNNNADGSTSFDFLGGSLLGKSTGVAGVDGFLTKLNSSGIQQWTKTLGGNASDVIEGMSVDSNGKIGVVGYSQNDSSDSNAVTDFKNETMLGRTTTVVSTGFMIRYSGP